MRKLSAILLTLSLAVAVPLLAADKGDATAGKAVFAKRCGTCHGPAGEGKEAIAKALKAEMHPLSSKQVQDKSDDELKKVMTQGSGKMKPVTGMSNKEIADVLAFVRSLAKK